MQSRKINGYPQQQYYDDDSTWMETKAQQLQSQGYPQTQQYPSMKPGYGNDSDYSMPNRHGHDSNHNMYHQDSKPHGLDSNMYHHQDSKPHGLDYNNEVYHRQDSRPHGLDSNPDVYHYQDKVPHGQGNGHGNGQMFPFGATTNHSPQHGNGVRPFNHRGQNDYVSENEYEVYKQERVGSDAAMRDEMRYERRGTYGDVRQANPYGYNNNRNNHLGHGTNKANWTLKGV